MSASCLLIVRQYRRRKSIKSRTRFKRITGFGGGSAFCDSGWGSGATEGSREAADRFSKRRRVGGAAGADSSATRDSCSILFETFLDGATLSVVKERNYK